MAKNGTLELGGNRLSKLLVLQSPSVTPHFATVVRNVGALIANIRSPGDIPDEAPEGLLLLPHQRLFVTAALRSPEIGSPGADTLARMFGWDGMLVVADPVGVRPLAFDAVLEQGGRTEWHTDLRLFRDNQGSTWLLPSGRRPALMLGKAGLVPSYELQALSRKDIAVGLERGASLLRCDIDRARTDRKSS